MLKVLKLLCRDKNVNISRPDKGNGVVGMDKSQYIAKMNNLLSNITNFKEIETNNNTFTKKIRRTGNCYNSRRKQKSLKTPSNKSAALDVNLLDCMDSQKYTKMRKIHLSVTSYGW